MEVFTMSGPRRIPSDYSDRDIMDAILQEIEWEEEGLPDPELELPGWWSTELDSPSKRREEES